MALWPDALKYLLQVDILCLVEAQDEQMKGTVDLRDTEARKRCRRRLGGDLGSGSKLGGIK